MAQTEDADWVHLELEDKQKEKKVVELLKPLRVCDSDMRKMMQIFETEMRLGVSASELDRRQSCTRMFIPPFYDMLDGTESGDYLGIDVGGTNFRILLVQLKDGKKSASTIIEFFDIPEELLDAPGEQLFKFIAERTVLFISRHRQQQINENSLTNIGRIVPERFRLGFCFSFPVEHISTRKAVLVTWGGRFQCADTIGRDVTEMLQTELDKLQANVDVVVNISDAIGTLVAGSVEDPATKLAFILGSGINGAMFEPVVRLPRLLHKVKGTDFEHESVMIESYCCALGDNGCIDFVNTVWDRRVMADTTPPGKHMLEKMCGGAYLVPLLRHILLDLMEKDIVLCSPETQKTVQCESCARTTQAAFRQALSTTTRAMSAKAISDIIRQPETNNDLTKTFLSSVLSNECADVVQSHSPHQSMITDDDCRITRYVCSLVSTRSAKICGALLAQHLFHNITVNDQQKGITIACTGSLFAKHPTIQSEMTKFTERFAPGYKFRFVVVEHGSGEGAAYCAAAASSSLQQYMSGWSGAKTVKPVA